MDSTQPNPTQPMGQPNPWTTLRPHSQTASSVVKVENLRRGNSIFSVAPSHDDRAHQMLMRVNIRCHVLPATSNCRQLFRTDVVIWSYTIVPVPFCLPFVFLEVQESCLPIIRGAGTPLPCVPTHFNQSASRSVQPFCGLTLVTNRHTDRRTTERATSEAVARIEND